MSTTLALALQLAPTLALAAYFLLLLRWHRAGNRVWDPVPQIILIREATEDCRALVAAFKLMVPAVNRATAAFAQFGVALAIDPETINRYVAERIVESSIGETLKKAIDEEIQKFARGYDNPMKGIVQSEAAKIAREYLETEEIQAIIKAGVVERMTPEVIEAIISEVKIAGRPY